MRQRDQTFGFHQRPLHIMLTQGEPSVRPTLLGRNGTVQTRLGEIEG